MSREFPLWLRLVLTTVQQMFETEKVQASGGGLHCHVLVALCDILGEKFTGRELWELCRQEMPR